MTEKKTGRPQGKGRPVNHVNRDCREGVVLALHLARLWKRDQYVLFGYRVMRYVVKGGPDQKNRSCRTLYRVTPAGEVTALEGPPYAGLFGREWVHVQFRLKSVAGPWSTIRADRFRPHERHRAEDRVRELAARNASMEYRLDDEPAGG